MCSHPYGNGLKERERLKREGGGKEGWGKERPRDGGRRETEVDVREGSKRRSKGGRREREG